MSHRVLWAVLGILCLVHAGCGGDSPTDPTREEPVNYRAGLRPTLKSSWTSQAIRSFDSTSIPSCRSSMPVGTSDGLLGVNQVAHAMLQSAGNPNLAFVTFPGGHDYRESDVEAMYLWLRRFASASDSR